MQSKHLEEIKVSLIEKIIVNWAMPFDVIVHNLIASFNRNIPYKNLGDIWDSKVLQYRKIIRILQKHGDSQYLRDVCSKTPCAKTRYTLAKLR